MNLFAGKLSIPHFIAVQLLVAQKVRFNTKIVGEKIYNHPEYPSLLSISDCLKDYNVSSEAFYISREEYKIKGLTTPCAIFFPDDNGGLRFVDRIENGLAYISDHRNKPSIMEESKFLQRWDGLVFYAESNELSGEKDYFKNRINSVLLGLRLPIIILLLSLILTLIFPILNSSIFIASLKLLGVIISVMLLLQSLNVNSTYLNRLCTFGAKNGCKGILKSSAAKLFNWLSWSEIGFFYFAGSLLFYIIEPAGTPILKIINLFCLPYTLYSIFYQLKSKNFCVLCSVVQLILWLEFIAFSVENSDSLSTAMSGLWPNIVIGFLAPIVLWSLIKPLIYDSEDLKSAKRQLSKFKSNTSLFQNALMASSKIEYPNEMSSVVLGNPSAPNTISIISNTFCSPCAKAHQFLSEWMSSRKDVKLEILFVVGDKDEDRTMVARDLTYLGFIGEEEILKLAIDDWFGQKMSYLEWKKLYTNRTVNEIPEFDKRWKELIKIQSEFYTKANIQFTPLILINGYKLPEPYLIEDIRYLLI